MCVYVHMHACMSLYKCGSSEDSFGELVLYYYVGPRDEDMYILSSLKYSARTLK